MQRLPSAFAALAAVCVLAVVLPVPATAVRWSSFGFGRSAAPQVGRCYKICPPVVFPWGHDPYYDTPFYIHETEMHGGPYGLTTLNPYTTKDSQSPVAGDVNHPVAGHWPGIRRPVVSMQLHSATPDSSPYPFMTPVNQAPFAGPTTERDYNFMFDKRELNRWGIEPNGMNPQNTFLQLSHSAAHAAGAVSAAHSALHAHLAAGGGASGKQAAARHGFRVVSVHRGSSGNGGSTRKSAFRGVPAASAFVELSAKKDFNPPCYHVCPHSSAPNEADETHGGPFGPDPPPAHRAANMFRHGSKQTGYGPFRNPAGEPYGGPFGPDPHYTYSDKSRSSGQRNMPPGGIPKLV